MELNNTKYIDDGQYKIVDTFKNLVQLSGWKTETMEINHEPKMSPDRNVLGEGTIKAEISKESENLVHTEFI